MVSGRTTRASVLCVRHCSNSGFSYQLHLLSIIELQGDGRAALPRGPASPVSRSMGIEGPAPIMDRDPVHIIEQDLLIAVTAPGI